MFASETSVVLVRGLSFNVRSNHVDEIFRNFGEVEDVELGYRNGHSIGSALVRFDSHASAMRAVSEMDHGNIDGIEITVELADPTKTLEQSVQASTT
jgi:RNA recognition motif-containing protein